MDRILIKIIGFEYLDHVSVAWIYYAKLSHEFCNR